MLREYQSSGRITNLFFSFFLSDVKTDQTDPLRTSFHAEFSLLQGHSKQFFLYLWTTHSLSMSVAILVRYATLSGSRVCCRAALGLTGANQKDPRRSLHCPSSIRSSNSRFDPDSSGKPTTWDSFGIWDNRIDAPILLPSSIRYGKLIPKVSLSKVGCASLIGQRKENEDQYQLSHMTDNIMYFAVFDGHGGAEAAEFCHKHMEHYIK